MATDTNAPTAVLLPPLPPPPPRLCAKIPLTFCPVVVRSPWLLTVTGAALPPSPPVPPTENHPRLEPPFPPPPPTLCAKMASDDEVIVPEFATFTVPPGLVCDPPPPTANAPPESAPSPPPPPTLCAKIPRASRPV